MKLVKKIWTDVETGENYVLGEQFNRFTRVVENGDELVFTNAPANVTDFAVCNADAPADWGYRTFDKKDLEQYKVK